jgi:hypothetical protein
MSEEKRLTLNDYLALLVVLIAAAGARVGYLVRYADSARNTGPVLVQSPSPVLADMKFDHPVLGKEDNVTELDLLIHNIKENSWFGTRAPLSDKAEKTAHLSPGYPLLLANLARAVGADRLESTTRWVQAGLGSLAAAFLFLFARVAFGSLLVALLAGLFAAFHPFWVVNVASMTDGVLTSFFLSLVLFLGARGGQTAGPAVSLFYGLSLAGLALVRAAMLPFTFVALGWYLLRSRWQSRGWLGALLACLGFFNGLAPWTVRNYQTFQQVIPVVDSTFLHLWVGNNPTADGGPATEAAYLVAFSGAEDGEKGSARSAELAAKPQAERYASLAPDVWNEVRANPEGTVHRRIGAGLYFLLGKQYFINRSLTEHVSGAPKELPQESSLTFAAVLLGMFLLAFLGWRWSYAWRKSSFPASLAMIWIPLPYLLGHAGMLHGPRLPLDGVLLCYAAFALMGLIPGIGDDLRNPPPPSREPEDDEDAVRL